jgi:hypothetical protein
MPPMPLRNLWVLSLSLLFAGCTPKIGNKCTLSTDCSQLGDRLCDSTQPGGYCTIFNCEPDNCPSSICVAFGWSLDPACGAPDGRWPRFERSFCMSSCGSSADCRTGYDCVDLSNPDNPASRRAQVVDTGAADAGGLGFQVCMAATCFDGLKNGDETDIDCGGTCKPCVVSCTDGVKNGDETDVDCGGTCKPCPSGRGCKRDADCLPNTDNKSVCSLHLSCTNPLNCPRFCDGACTNGGQDGDETDVDCGGTCPKCGLGKACKGNADCASDVCTTAGVCDVPPVCKAYSGDGGVPWTPYSPDAGP